MAFDDKNYSTLFPTRFGTPTGTANERQMLDGIEGAAGIKKTYRTQADGSVVRCETRNGMPRFFTTAKHRPAAGKERTLYMESGQLSWPYYVTNPGGSGWWDFMDISPYDLFLGEISTAHDDLGSQENDPLLFDGQGSLAIGQAEGVTKYGGTVLTKKIVAAFYPSSVFSGKMRLFMQAQYGAPASIPFNFSIETIGESILLHYSYGGAQVQFGVWSGSGVGVYYAGDGKWWLIQITSTASSSRKIYAAPLEYGAAVAPLIEEYQLAGITSSYAERIEGYIFAHSYFRVDKRIFLGEFAAAGGTALAYGWKWNSSGALARIVVHDVLGTGVQDMRWASSTITVQITGGDAISSIAASVSSVSNGEWTDGWGSHNIFAPTNELISEAPLVAKSMKMSRQNMPDFAFSAEIYGYFAGDEWVSVALSRILETDPKKTFASSGCDYLNPPDGETNVYTYGVIAGGSDASAIYSEIASQTTMVASIGGSAYSGKASHGTHVLMGKIHKGAAFNVGNAVDFGSRYALSPQSPTSTYSNTHVPSGFPPDGAVKTLWPTVKVQQCVDYRTEITGVAVDAWTLIIPSCDAEAVFITERKSFDNVESYSTTTSEMTDVVGFIGVYSLVSSTNGPWIPFEFSTWNGAYGGNTWYIGETFPVTTSTEVFVPEFPPPVIHCHSSALGSAVGTPAHGYYALFTVSRHYPFYEPGMYSLSSAGKRYVISEGLKNPQSVDHQKRFVGWA